METITIISDKEFKITKVIPEKVEEELFNIDTLYGQIQTIEVIQGQINAEIEALKNRLIEHEEEKSRITALITKAGDTFKQPVVKEESIEVVDEKIV
jgi:hypothetical protein